jgi:hypothetical protein
MKLAYLSCAPTVLTNLEESKLVRRIGRADDDCFNVAHIYITTCNGEGCSKVLSGPYLSMRKPEQNRECLQRSEFFCRSANSYDVLSASRPHHRIWIWTCLGDANNRMVRHGAVGHLSVEESEDFLFLGKCIR